jgi:non-ribosomal peptide synthase protein (TIGR01720 family)
MNTIDFIYELNRHNFFVYLEDDQLKYIQHQETEKKTQFLSLLKMYEKEIVRLLKLNKFNEDKIPRPGGYFIYRTDSSQEALSFAQERLWFRETYEETASIPESMIFEIPQETNRDILKKSIQSVVNRHQILRTTLIEDEEGVSQKVLDADEYFLKIKTCNLSRSDELSLLIEESCKRPYDLTQEYPIRVFFYEIPGDLSADFKSKTLLHILVHPIAFDTRSISLWVQDLETHYHYYLKKFAGEEAILDIPEIFQYKDFSVWQRNDLEETLEKSLKDWKKKLETTEMVHLITDYPRHNCLQYAGNVPFEIEESLSLALRSLAQELQVSLVSVLLSGYYLFLRCYTGQKDLMLGMPMVHASCTHVIGPLTYTAVIAKKIHPETELNEFIQSVHREIIEVKRQELPWEKLEETLKLNEDHRSLILFGMQHLEPQAGSILKPYQGNLAIAKIISCDLSTFLDDSQNIVKGIFYYDLNLYAKETIHKFIQSYLEILGQFSEISKNFKLKETKIQQLYVSDSECQAIIKDWNQIPAKELSDEKSEYLTLSEYLPKNVDEKLEGESLFRKSYVAPRNRIQKQLCEIWAEILNLPMSQVGIRDDFFKLGGNTSQSRKLVILMRKKLGVKISLKVIFQERNIERCYHHVLLGVTHENKSLEAKQNPLKTTLMPIQNWFFERSFENANHWNQSFVIKTSKLHLESLQASLVQLVNYHDSLRLRYQRNIDGNFIPYYTLSTESDKIQTWDLREIQKEPIQEINEPLAKKINEKFIQWQDVFDLETGPILSVGYIEGYPDESARLHIAVHQLAADARSLKILVEDLKTLYQGNTLIPKKNNYGTWTQLLDQYKKNHPSEKLYWEKVLKDYDPKTSFHSLKDPKKRTFFAKVSLNQEETDHLFHKCHQAYHTKLDEILLTALSQCLHHLTGNCVNHIVIENDAREIEDSLDLTTQIGWFTIWYPVRLENQSDLAKNIDSIKKTLRQIPNHAIGYGPICGYHTELMPQVRLSYVDIWEQKTSEDFWKITDEPGGNKINTSEDPYTVSIHGSLIHGKLTFDVSGKLHQASITELAQVFEQNLKKILHHTLNLSRTYLTPTDTHFMIPASYLDQIQEKKEIQGIYLTNDLQRGLIYDAIHEVKKDETIQVIWQYHWPLEAPRLKQAWSHAQKKFPSLRLRLSWNDPWTQIIDQEGTLHWKEINLSDACDLSDQNLALEKLQQEDRNECYKLDEGSLFRVYLIEQKKDLFTCLFSYHQSILDRSSVSLLLEEIHATYLSLNTKLGEAIPDYTYENLQKYLLDHRNTHQAYWNGYLSQMGERPDFSPLLKINHQQTKLHTYKNISDPCKKAFKIHGKLYQEIQLLSDETDLPLSAILQYAWHQALSLYSYTQQSVIGVAVSYRSLDIPGIKTSVGAYTGILPLFVNPKNSIRIIDSIRMIYDQIQEMHTRNTLNLEALQKQGERLFDSIFIYHEPYMMRESSRHNLKMSLPRFIKKPDCPFVVTVDESIDHLLFQLHYPGELFQEKTMKDLLDLVKFLVEQIVLSPKQLEKNLSYLPAEQSQRTHYNENATENTLNEQTIHGLFEAQVQKTPDAIAAIDQKIPWTYREVNEKANRLANYLINVYRMPPETPLCLLLEKSVWSLIAILATWKAGFACVSLDPDSSEEHIGWILQDTQAPVILTDHKNHLFLQSKDFLKKEDSARVVVILDSSSLQTQLLHSSEINPTIESSRFSLAAILYYLETDHQLPGVMLEHLNIVHAIDILGKITQLKESNILQNVLWVGTKVFGIHVWEILTTICYGHTLHIADLYIKKDPLTLKDYIKHKNIYLACIPSEILSLKLDLSCKVLVVTENNPPIFDFYTNLGIEVIQVHGTLETSGVAMVQRYQKNETSIIALPLQNTKYYILNEHLKALPAGAIGLLYLGGAGLARGYFQEEALTSQKFITNAFQTEEEKKAKKNGRLYRTGEIARQLTNGTLEYLPHGRFQAQIGDYVLDLKSIQAALETYPGIKQGIVVAQRHPDDSGVLTQKHLVAYYVSDENQKEKDLLSYLQQHLPKDILIPLCVHLKTLPLDLTENIDLNALPEAPYFKNQNYIPKNEIQTQICSIWAEVLGLSVDQIALQEDFLRLGGDSILSIQIANRIRKKLGWNIHSKDILHCRSIEKLYHEFLSQLVHQKNILEIKTEPGRLTGPAPLLPIQKWFFDRKFTNKNHWNQCLTIKTPKLDIQKLQASVIKLTDYYNSLHLRYTSNDDGNATQFYDSSAQAPRVKVWHLAETQDGPIKEMNKELIKKINEKYNQWQVNFDLKNGPLFHIGYVDGYADGSARLHCTIHHLIGDAMSLRILAESLQRFYEEMPCEPQGSSYRQWAETVLEYGKNHDSEKNYWNDVLKDYHPDTSLNHLSDLEGFSYNSSLSFNPEETNKLLRDCHEAYDTKINDIFLTALGSTLSDFTGNDVNFIMRESHGRENIDSQIDVTCQVGWFTTMHPVRLEYHKDLGENLSKTKERLKKIPHEGIGYGALLGYQSEYMPQVYFNYIGQLEKSVSLKNKEYWEITDETCGRNSALCNEDPYLVRIHGDVVSKRLTFNIISKLNRNATIQLGKIFKKRLKETINYLLNLNRKYLTLSDIHHIISFEYLEQLQKKKEIKSVYIANSLQKKFIYDALNEKHDDLYCAQIIWQYQYCLDPQIFKETWKYAQKKYPSLRLRFAWDEQLVQIIDQEGDLHWTSIDLSFEPDLAIQNLSIQKIQEKDGQDDYELDQGSLFRVHLIKQSKKLFTCLLSYHPAIMDSLSVAILLDFIHSTYLKLKNQRTTQELAIDHTYETTQQYLQNHPQLYQDYWDHYLSKIQEKPILSKFLKSTQKHLKDFRQMKEPQQERLKIEGKLYGDLKEISQKKAVSLQASLLYVWHKILSIYGHAEQTTVGITLPGRHLPLEKLESSVGLYSNALPLFVNHKKNMRIIKVIEDIEKQIHEMDRRSHSNSATLHQKKERLFDSLFIYQQGSINQKHKNRLKINIQESVERTDYPIVLIAYEKTNHLIFQINYAGELIQKPWVEDCIVLAKILLEQIATQSEMLEKNLRYLSEEQSQRILYDWNATDQDSLIDQTVPSVFEKQEEKMGIAIISQKNVWTYQDLNQRANQLAHYILEKNLVTSEMPVCLLLEKSDLMLLAILATLKVGCGYVPIDPNSSQEHIHFILQDTQASVILTDEIHASFFSSDSIFKNFKSTSMIIIDNIQFQSQLTQYPPSNPQIKISPSDLACMMYTKDKMGNAQGVMLEHRGILHLTEVFEKIYQPKENSTKKHMLCFSHHAWDLHLAEIFTALCQGHVLHITDASLKKDLKSLNSYIQYQKIDLAWIPASLLSLDSKLDVKVLVVVGKKIDSKIFDFYTCTGTEIIHIDGIIEGTIASSIYIYKNKETTTHRLQNTKYYITDEDLNPIPQGAIGTLYLGGLGLARGYFQQEALTSKKFIANPFQTEEEKKAGKNARIYQTGDLARWLPNGTTKSIEFHHSDLQTDFSEFKTIEAALEKYEGIKQALVLPKEHLETFTEPLTGYYVSEKKYEKTELIKYLQKELPERLVPNNLVHLKKLTYQGIRTLDENSLPEVSCSPTETYLAPRNEMESQIREIWAEVLHVPIDQIGVRDAFLKLGGDDTIAIQLISRMRKRLGLKIHVKDIFNTETIEQLCEHIAFNLKNDTQEILKEKARLEGEVPLLPIQKWFFEKKFKRENHWNHSFLVKTPELDFEQLQASVIKLVEYHDNLQLRYYKKSDGSYVQVYDNSVQSAELKVWNIREIQSETNQDINKCFAKTINKKFTKWQNQFDLEHGPIFSISYVHGYADGSARLHIAIHHLIVDERSCMILLEDLKSLYHRHALEPKKSSYRQWTQAVANYGRTHASEKTYWENVLKDYDHHSIIHEWIEPQEGFNFSSFSYTTEETLKLLKDCHEAYGTQIQDLLLTALAASLSELTGNQVNHIVIENHGKENIEPRLNITRQVGWFTTMYPVRLEHQQDTNKNLLKTKKILQQIPHNGIGYGPLFGYQSPPLPQLRFSYLGSFEDEITLLEHEPWQIVDEHSGVSIHSSNQDTYMIAIDTFVKNKTLKFSIYSKLNKYVTHQLVRFLKKNIKILVEHTLRTSKRYQETDSHTIISTNLKPMEEKENAHP